MRHNQRGAYLVEVGSRFAITTNKRHAYRIAKHHGGGRIFAMPLAEYRQAGAWDYPTFCVMAREIAVV
jgi:hypothetical protein